MKVIFFIVILLIIVAVIFGLFKLSGKYRIVSTVFALSITILMIRHTIDSGGALYNKVAIAFSSPDAWIFIVAFFIVFIIIIAVTVPLYKKGNSLLGSIAIGWLSIPLLAIIALIIIKICQFLIKLF